MSKQMLFSDAAWQKVKDGITATVNTMKVTLGPAGRNVLLGKTFGNPEAVNDGKSISKEIELPDPFENMGAKLINEASEKTSDVAGDGTTTAAILTQSIYENGLKYIAVGANPLHVKHGLDQAVETVVNKLKEMSTPVKDKEDYRKVATVASNYDTDIGQIIAEAMEKVGKEGVITVEEGKSRDTKLEFAEGMDFDKGYISPYFVNKPENLTVEFEDPYILIYEKKITSAQELVPLLETVVPSGRPLLLIAEEVEGEALTLLVVNKMQGTLKVCAVKAPAFGDRKKAVMQDIAVLTGGTVISEESGRKLENVIVQELGQAGKIKVEKEKTTIIEGKGGKKKIADRIEQIRKLLKETTSEYDREKFEERLAKIQGGIALIKIGAVTEAEMKERRPLVENAVHAAQAARIEGILPGGSVAYLRAIPQLVELEKSLKDDDEKIGVRIIINALQSPLKQLAVNAGHDPSTVLEEVKEKTGMTGYDINSGRFVNMMEAGIVDPTKVVRLALQNAASIAGTVLTSRTMITDLKDKKKKIEGSIR